MDGRCEDCGQVLDAPAADWDAAAVVCRACGAVYARRLAAGASRESVARPGSVTVTTDGGGLRLVWRWRHPQLGFWMLFTAIWNLVAGWLLWALLVNGDWGLLPVVGGFALLGLGLVYYTLAQAANRSTIQLDRRELRVSHGPLPWPGGKRVAASTIRGLHCRRVEVRNARNARSAAYELMAATDGRPVRLLGQMHQPQQALYLQQQLSQALELPESAVEPG